MMDQWSETVKLRPAGEEYAVEKRAREPQTPAPVLCSRLLEQIPVNRSRTLHERRSWRIRPV
jgi:hypothetical protein